MDDIKQVLVTGGTGSFGGAVVKRLIANPSIERVIVFSRDEKKQHDMRLAIESKKLHLVVGDVRDRDALVHALQGVDAVFHAAALKQVPTGEFFPMEMVKTNILGTNNMLEAATIAGVKKVVALSTDKAVYPINAMGMTKALLEKLVTAYAREASKTTFSVVRYGNVAASRGSVIPLFIDRMRAGKSLPITHPAMTRFLLSLDDAVDLVELALSKGEQGDIFIKKSPAATIADLAEATKLVFKSEAPIERIGIRRGEKMHEALANAIELINSEDLGTHFRIRTQGAMLYEKYFEEGDAEAKVVVDYTSESAERLSVSQIEEFLRSLEYIQDASRKHA